MTITYGPHGIKFEYSGVLREKDAKKKQEDLGYDPKEAGFHDFTVKGNVTTWTCDHYDTNRSKSSSDYV